MKLFKIIIYYYKNYKMKQIKFKTKNNNYKLNFSTWKLKYKKININFKYKLTF